jgi:hypothetical protein
VDYNKRPSVYLVEKCETLQTVLNFFLNEDATHGRTANEKLLVFLLQLDFWEWEVDNLIYSFESFATRAASWEHENAYGFVNVLKNRGIAVNIQALGNLKGRRQDRAKWASRVIAPTESLNNVLAKWNELITRCEERILVPKTERSKMAEWGIELLPDLSRFRKQLPPTDAKKS